MPDAPALRVAVVGTGEPRGREHARVFGERHDTALVAVVGTTAELTESRAAQLGARPYTSLSAMLEAEQPDLVSLCLPNEEHFDAGLEVIRAGVPLLVETPLVFEQWQAEYLLVEAAKRDLFFAINLSHRYATPVRLAAAAIAAGDLGGLVCATWRFAGEAGTSTHLWADLIETQCHGFDLLEHLCGPITSVAAQATDVTANGWSTVAVALAFGNGAVGSLVGSCDSSYAYARTQSLEVNGTLGRVLVEDTVRRYTQSRTGDPMARVWEAGYLDDRGRDLSAMFSAHLDELVPALRAGGPPPVHATAGARALDLAAAVITSAQERRHVAVPPPKP